MAMRYSFDLSSRLQLSSLGLLLFIMVVSTITTINKNNAGIVKMIEFNGDDNEEPQQHQHQLLRLLSVLAENATTTDKITTTLVFVLASFLGTFGVALTGFGMAIIFLFVYNIGEWVGLVEKNIKEAVFIQTLALAGAIPVMLWRLRKIIKAYYNKLLLLAFIPVTIIGTPLGNLCQDYIDPDIMRLVIGIIVTGTLFFELYRMIQSKCNKKKDETASGGDDAGKSALFLRAQKSEWVLEPSKRLLDLEGENGEEEQNGDDWQDNANVESKEEENNEKNDDTTSDGDEKKRSTMRPQKSAWVLEPSKRLLDEEGEKEDTNAEKEPKCNETSEKKKRGVMFTNSVIEAESVKQAKSAKLIEEANEEGKDIKTTETTSDDKEEEMKTKVNKESPKHNEHDETYGHKPRTVIIAGVICGLLSGFLGGLIGIRGPPLIIFFLLLDYPKKVVRGNGVLILLVNVGIRCTYYAIEEITASDNSSKKWNNDLWYVYVGSILAGMAGVPCGKYVADRINQEMFKLALGFLLLISGLSNLILGSIAVFRNK